MIDFKEKTLDNGLRVISTYDKFTPMATLNLIYNVGSKNENPERTGMAHLLEHLMFGGSQHVPDFDFHAEMAGGANNAFTSADFTNYYISMPSVNIETAFWLESDRMGFSALTKEKLEIQRKVVLEEFKERVMNPPYGKAMPDLLDMTYEEHPYKWPVIGKELAHIDKMSLADVRDFFTGFYTPNNAFLSVAGSVAPEKVFDLAEKWFGHIPKNEKPSAALFCEPIQTKPKSITVEKDIPLEAVFMSFHMHGRKSTEYICADLLSDILSSDRSSRFYKLSNKEDAVFAQLHAAVNGHVEHGLFIVQGKINKGHTVQEAVELIERELVKIVDNITDEETHKVLNKAVTAHEVTLLDHSNKALNLGFSALLGDTNYINTQIDEYLKITTEDLRKTAKKIFKRSNSNTLIYKAK